MKIGIYGGSYNPIHRGHTELARLLVEQGLVDEVWLLVSPLNPLKQGETAEIAPYEHRLRMAELATEGMRGVRVSDFEGHLPVPSYMVHTLAELRRAYPEHEFTLVVGADNWLRFDRWYKSDEIRAQYPILVYRRPGYEVDVKTVDAPLFDISSTQLREAIRRGENTDEWLDGRVREYIREHGLYGEKGDKE
ncbi:MAG: nicotinate (nicotinamide) nucleotide adenylyltransferase [Bacteroidaceae bacterium]|nr:nicotinate (nicotinamide) nucleotide adenylyltransferase [Bacteroidaceae bacterium]